ncbi:MAG: hypothetical protein R2883_06230 [Caldisericia bacterium]
MKLLKIGIVFLLVISVFTPVYATSQIPSETAVSQLSDSIDSSYFPVLTDSYAVWRTNGGKSKIISMDRKTEERVTLNSEGSYNATYLNCNWMSDEFVLWFDERSINNGGSSFRQIYACETSGGDEFLVSDPAAIDCFDVCVWDKYAVFTQYFEGGGNSSGLYFCDLTDIGSRKLLEADDGQNGFSNLQFFHGKAIWTKGSQVKYYDLEVGAISVACSDAHETSSNLVMNSEYIFYVDGSSNICSLSLDGFTKKIIKEASNSEVYPLISNPDSDYLLFEAWGTGGSKLYSYMPGEKAPKEIITIARGTKITDNCTYGKNLVYVKPINSFKFIMTRNLETGQETMVKGIADQNTYPLGIMIHEKTVAWYEKSWTPNGFKSNVFVSEVK